MDFLTSIQHNYAFIFCFAIMAVGLYQIIISDSGMKKLFGLTLLQAPVLVYLIAVSKIDSARSPIQVDGADVIYANPLPHVLVLTAIVVGIAILAVGLALIIRMHRDKTDSA